MSLRLLYTTAHSLMMDQSGPKHVRVFKLKHFVGLICNYKFLYFYELLLVWNMFIS
jgi:hypothetical protein